MREANEDSISTIVRSNVAGAILAGSHHCVCGASRYWSGLVCQETFPRENREIAAGRSREEST